MPLTVQNTIGTLADLELSNKELMREIGLLAREAIVRRTLSGQSSDGTPFAPYSDGYAKAKQQALGSSSPVNLQASGRMLNDIQVTETEDSVTLSFRS
jgi:hypothetical protein